MRRKHPVVLSLHAAQLPPEPREASVNLVQRSAVAAVLKIREAAVPGRTCGGTRCDSEVVKREEGAVWEDEE